MAYKDPAKYRDYQSSYHREHREEARDYAKAYYAEHSEQWQEYNQNQHEYLATHRTERNAYGRQYYARNREAHSAFMKEYRAKRIAAARMKAFEVHGHNCSCCGETNEIFLTLHHVNGDGHDDRSQRNEIAIWNRAATEPGAYRILCWNCHMAIHHNGGHCPHEANQKVRI